MTMGDNTSSEGMGDFVLGMLLLGLLLVLSIASIATAVVYCVVKKASVTSGAKWAVDVLGRLDCVLGLASFFHPSTASHHDVGDDAEGRHASPGIPTRRSRPHVWCVGFCLDVAVRAVLVLVTTIGWICAASEVAQNDGFTRAWATCVLLWGLLASLYDAIDLALQIPIAVHYLLPKVTADPVSCCHLADREKVLRWTSGAERVVAVTKAQPFVAVAVAGVLIVTGITVGAGGSYVSGANDNALVFSVLMVYAGVVLRIPVFAVGLARASVLVCERNGAAVGASGGRGEGGDRSSGLSRKDSIGAAGGGGGDPAVAAAAKGAPLVATARYNFAGRAEDELHFNKGDKIIVLRTVLPDDGWWQGRLGTSQGMFPANRVILDDDGGGGGATGASTEANNRAGPGGEAGSVEGGASV